MIDFFSKSRLELDGLYGIKRIWFVCMFGEENREWNDSNTKLIYLWQQEITQPCKGHHFLCLGKIYI